MSVIVYRSTSARDPSCSMLSTWRTIPSWPIAVARSRLSTWRPTDGRRLPGRMLTAGAGPSTSSNAGSRYFEDYSDLVHLDKIAWDAVQADYWSSCKDGKQAEFLIERSFPWALVSRIGVWSPGIGAKVRDTLLASRHRPTVAVRRGWYY